MNQSQFLSVKDNNIKFNFKNSKNRPFKRFFGKDITNLVLKNHNSHSVENNENFFNFELIKNPQWVEDYESNIFDNLEHNIYSFKYNKNYLTEQPDLNIRMREILIDWIIDVHNKFKLSQDCLFKTINILDFVLSKKIIKRNQLQLIGIASMFISSKYEEINPIKLKHFIAVCDYAYKKNEILEMESEILIWLDFKLNTPNYTNYINKIKNILNLNNKAVKYSNYLIELGLLSYKMLKYDFFVFISGVFFIINKIFNKKGWDDNLKNIFKTEENLVKDCANRLFILKDEFEKLNWTAIKRKYSTKENYEISKYLIQKH